jgi:integrase
MHTTLTENAIRAADPNTTLWDGTVRHFGLRVTPAGTKSFIVLLGSGRRLAIGRYPTITLAQARLKAKTMLAEKILGRFQPQTMTWEAGLKIFLEHIERTRRPRTHKEYKRALNLYFDFGTTRLVDVTREDIGRKLDKLNAVPAMKSRALTYCKTFFNWCVKERGWLLYSPCTMTVKKSKKRKRVLTDDELRQVWIAAGECGTFGIIVRLLMLTGQRRGEIGGLRKSFYSHNEQTICLPEWQTKNGREHTFPIGVLCADILYTTTTDSLTAFLFPARGKPMNPFNGWSKSKQALDKLCPIPHWTLHDLRRTFRTNLARLGVAPHIGERLVNHVSARTDMEETYDLWRYMPEMRAAMELWENHLKAICCTA